MMKFIENNKFLNEMENFMDLARVVSLGLGPVFMIFSHYVIVHNICFYHPKHVFKC